MKNKRELRREDIEEQLREFFESDGRIDAVFLHGSAAAGTMRPDSDVDAALLPAPGRQIGGRERMEMAGKLECALGRPVDVGVMNHRNLTYEKQVATRGRCILCRDHRRRDEFLATALALYVQLRLERREVEGAYAAEQER